MGRRAGRLDAPKAPRVPVTERRGIDRSLQLGTNTLEVAAIRASLAAIREALWASGRVKTWIDDGLTTPVDPQVRVRWTVFAQARGCSWTEASIAEEDAVGLSALLETQAVILNYNATSLAVYYELFQNGRAVESYVGSPEGVRFRSELRPEYVPRMSEVAFVDATFREWGIYLAPIGGSRQARSTDSASAT